MLVLAIWLQWIRGRLMVQISDLAANHQALRTKLSHAATAKGLRLWRQVDPAYLDAGWDRIAPSLSLMVTAGQVTAARQAVPFTNGVTQSYGFAAERATLVPEAFGGVMLDGREVGSAMFGAVTTAKTAIGRGMAPGRAFEVGANFLATIIGAAIQDAGRQADHTIATGKGYTHYVRVVSPGACSRCAILAGKDSYQNAFLRHPRCKCTSAPLPDDLSSPAGTFNTPTDYFESLSRAEQDKAFTKSGAYAIRNGANPVSVVNARRGALNAGGLNGSPNRMVKTVIGRKADGSPLEVFLTHEGTTARGAFFKSESALTQQVTRTGNYRRSTTVRLMPEQIQVMSDGNPARARELLKKYGYLDF